jgi:hypothetical protein
MEFLHGAMQQEQYEGVIQNQILQTIYGGNRHPPRTVHTALSLITWNEEIEGEFEKLHQFFRQHDNPIIVALSNCDTNIHYTCKRPKQMLH